MRRLDMVALRGQEPEVEPECFTYNCAGSLNMWMLDHMRNNAKGVSRVEMGKVAASALVNRLPVQGMHANASQKLMILGISSIVWHGVPFVVSDQIPEDEIHYIAEDGRIVGRVYGIES